MKDVTTILSAVAEGNSGAAHELLPLVYEELRQLAKKVEREVHGHSLNATALVHEAYVRLVGSQKDSAWQNRGYFFAAAAQAMRRILVEHARRKSRQRHGGEFVRRPLDLNELPSTAEPCEVLAVDEALNRLAREDSLAAEIVKLRYFAGLSIEEAGNATGVSRANAYRNWKFARAWLQCEFQDDDGSNATPD